MPTLADRLKHAWNAFTNKDPTYYRKDLGMSSSLRPDRVRFTRGNERSIITTIYNRIAIDVSSLTIEHVQLDDQDRYVSTIDSGLNTCLNLEANIDQTGRAFIQDIVMSMFDEGCIAIVPTDTDDEDFTTAFGIQKLRTAQILEWFPKHVRIRAYNEETGRKEDIIMPKEQVAIIENPFFAIMNEPNSTLQRLVRKLSILDAIDEQSGSGKLDLIIQLPYLVKSEARKKQADLRRKEIEDQLAGSKYGIAYTDGTEHIQQLNRSVENNILTQIEYLTNLLYAQLGITVEVLDGTADEKTMLNYNNRVLEPIISAIVDEMKRKFLTKTSRTQGKTIMYFREPFKIVPVEQLANIGDTFTRNEIMTSNELRQVIGLPPSSDPNADMLRNKNMPMQDEPGATEGSDAEYQQYASELDSVDAELEETRKMLGG